MAQLKDSIVAGDLRITDTLYSNKIANSMRAEVIYENVSGDEIVPAGLMKTFTAQSRPFLQLTIKLVDQSNNYMFQILNMSYGGYVTNIVYPWSGGEMTLIPVQIWYEGGNVQINLSCMTGNAMGLIPGQSIKSHTLSDLGFHLYLCRVVSYWFE